MATRVGWVLLTPELPGHGPGGIGSWAEDLAHGLHAAGESLEVWTPARRLQGAHYPWPIRKMPGRSWRTWGAWWVDGYARARHFSGSAPTLIVATWPLATRIAHWWPGPVLVAAHGSDLTRWDRAPAGLLALTDRVTFLPVSNFLSKELDRLGLNTTPRWILPMALPETPPAQAKGSALVCVARATPLKGLDRAIGFAARLGRPLWLVGCTAAQVNPLHPQLTVVDRPVHERTLAPTPQHPHTLCLGPQPREVVADILQSSGGALLFARTDPQGRGAEGLGLGLLEAARLGRPLLGSPIGGIPEALGPGRCLNPEDPFDPMEINAWLDNPASSIEIAAWLRRTHNPSLTLTTLFAARDQAHCRGAR